MSRPWVVGWWVVMMALGCDDTSVANDLTVTAQPAGGKLSVDVGCDPSCGGDATLEVHVTYAPSKSVQEGTVQFLQYRVDYALAGVPGNVPYFADGTSFSLSSGKDDTETLLVVGSAQRDFVRQATGGQTVTGTAKLTLAGYDANNHQVFVDATFEVTFSRSADAGVTADAGAGDAG